ncbi:MAG TPA: hypothetical protein VNV86_13305 [Candidatus Acidoferrum sp.]|nr:hypothetical protein [Candidatus Acidoferrum sp.]
MRNLMLMFLLSTYALSAQEAFLRPQPDPASKARTLWKASVLSLAAANALDVHSSWGKHESNPALGVGPQAKFGVQGALIKMGLQGGLMGLEYLITRGHPTGKVYKALSFVNFGAAAGVGMVAAHNYTIGPVR